MGRAFLLVFFMLPVFLFLNLSHIKMEENSNEWKSFSLQYQLLIDDGKLSLADKLLNKRLPQMREYVRTLSREEQQVWKALFTSVTSGQATAQQYDQFLSFLEAAHSDTFDQWITSETNQLQEMVMDVTNSPEDLLNEWNRVAPVFYSQLSKGEFDHLNQLISNLNSNDTFGMREYLNHRLNEMAPDSSTAEDAIFWTAIIIGTSIIVTLFYVGYRKYMAARNELSRKSENS